MYFNAIGQKVFDVTLNNDHSIVSDLDIYSHVGHGAAYDEVIPFTIADNVLRVQVSRCLVSLADRDILGGFPTCLLHTRRLTI